jgi:uncharacterized protein YjbJ (UPF0337 family)
LENSCSKESIANDHHLQGAVSDVAGRVESAAAAIADDPATELKGQVRQASAKLEAAYGDALDAVRNARESVARLVKSYPMAAVVTAATVGFILRSAMHRD